MFWAGIVLLGGFAFLTVHVYLTPDAGSANEEEVARLRGKKGKARVAALDRDWPGWRGPNRDGSSPEKGLYLDWAEKEPPILWRAPIGDGFGSIAVVKGRVYTQFQGKDNEVVGCFDALSGKEIWRHTYAARFEDKFGSGPRSTPTVEGGLVYTVGATGILHCLDADKGNVKWSKDLKNDFGVGVPTWGFSFSPLVVGDLVLINPGGKAGKSIAGLNRYSGEIRWQNLDVGGGYSSPVLAEIEGETQVVFFTSYGLVSVLPESGKELWRYPWKTDFDANIATPIVFDNYVFISSGYNAGSALVRISKEGDNFQATKVYHHKKMANHFSSSVYHEARKRGGVERTLFGFHEATLVCLDAMDPMENRKDKPKWTERDFQRGNLLLVEDHLIILGENGRLGVALATQSGYVEKGRMDVFEGPLVWSAPALADGLLFVRDRKEIVCINLKK